MTDRRRAGVRIPIAAEGWPFIFPLAVAACTLAGMGWWAAAGVVAVPALAFLGFFRDPERQPPDLPGAVLAPADGKVMEVALVDDAWVGPAARVSIFLSPLDVHINRAPVAGLGLDAQLLVEEYRAQHEPRGEGEVSALWPTCRARRLERPTQLTGISARPLPLGPPTRRRHRR